MRKTHVVFRDLCRSMGLPYLHHTLHLHNKVKTVLMIFPWLPNEVMCILACSFLSCDLAVTGVTEAALNGCVVKNISGKTFSLCLSTAVGFLNKKPERVCHNISTLPPCYTPMAGIRCKVLTGESQWVLGPPLERGLGEKLRQTAYSAEDEEGW